MLGDDLPMKRSGLIALLLLLAGCSAEKGIIDRDGYQLDTAIRRRQPTRE
jgi:uncharacterized lipoprotein YmbA